MRSSPPGPWLGTTLGPRRTRRCNQRNPSSRRSSPNAPHSSTSACAPGCSMELRALVTPGRMSATDAVDPCAPFHIARFWFYMADDFRVERGHQVRNYWPFAGRRALEPVGSTDSVPWPHAVQGRPVWSFKKRSRCAVCGACALCVTCPGWEHLAPRAAMSALCHA